MKVKNEAVVVYEPINPVLPRELNMLVLEFSGIIQIGDKSVLFQIWF